MLRLLLSATKVGSVAWVMLLVGAIDAAVAQTVTPQPSTKISAANDGNAAAAISTLRDEDVLIQRLAGRAIKHTSVIGRTTTQTLARQQRRSAMALRLPQLTAPTPATVSTAVAAPAPVSQKRDSAMARSLPIQSNIAKASKSEAQQSLVAPLAAAPSAALAMLRAPLTLANSSAVPTAAQSVPAAPVKPVRLMRPVASVRRQPVPTRLIAQVPQTPLPPLRQVAVKSQLPSPTMVQPVVTERVFQSPNATNYAAPTNPAYLPAAPYQAAYAGVSYGGAVQYPAYAPPQVPVPTAAYAQPYAQYGQVAYRPVGYPMALPPRFALPPMPALPSPYAALQAPANAGMPRLTPPVSRMSNRALAPQIAPAGLSQVAPLQQSAPPSYVPSQAANNLPPVAPSSVPNAGYYAAPYPVAVPYAQVAPNQQYVAQPYYAVPQPQYYAAPQQYGAPQQYYLAPVAIPVAPTAQPPALPVAPSPAAPVPVAQPIIPQLGTVPQPIANPLNAPLAVPVSPGGVPSPSTDATALKGTNRSSAPLIRSTATTEPSLILQGVYSVQGGDGSARARISGLYPLSPRALFGATLDVASGDGFADTEGDGFTVNELFFATSLAEIPNLRFVVGQMDLTSYFDRNSFAKDGATHFFNSIFQTNPALAAAGIGSRPGLLVNWSLSDNLEAKAAAFSASRRIEEFAFNGFAGELGLRYGNAILRGTYVTGRDSGNNDSFQEAFTVNRGNNQFGLLEDDRESAFGINGEVFIPQLKMGLFARYGRYENLDAEQTADTFGAGVSFLDVFSSDDRLGLAYGSALSNDSLRRSTGRGKVDALELFYDFRFLPNLRVGVTLQQRDAFSEVVAGVRVKTEFDITPKGRVVQ